MTQQQALSWSAGSGWLVLSGDPDSLGDIRAQALSRVYREGHLTYIGTSEDDYDDFMDDMGELGAPTGYLVNVLQEDDNTIRNMIGQASMVILSGDLPATELKSVLIGPGLEGIKQAYDAGAVILAEAEAAKVFGAMFANAQDRISEGFDWVNKAVIVPSHESITESTSAHALLTAKEVQVAIGLGIGSALVLGPNGEVETWGEAVSIVLGGSVATET